jgi:3-oxoacyl-[acyl-carrier protein] reductase
MTPSPAIKTAIVTGASRGIGKACALRLAADGFAVVVNYLSRAGEAEAVVAEIAAAGGRAVAQAADVGDALQAARLFDRAEEAFGGVDAVVNCAGLIALGPVASLAEEDFDRVMAANARGTFNLLKLAATRVRPGGSVVTFSTTALHLCLPGYVAYNASKAAVEAMTRVVSKELAPVGITVNAIAPGPVATEMFFTDKSQELVDRLIAMTPLGRLGEVEDIAPLVSFLVGPGARWITGQVVRVNGGFG